MGHRTIHDQWRDYRRRACTGHLDNCEEVNRILVAATGDSNLAKWRKFSTFTVGSTNLFQFQELTATDIEDLLLRLCELKWFYRTQEGKFGIDLRCIAELEEYLTSMYNLNTCQKLPQAGNSRCQVRQRIMPRRE